MSAMFDYISGKAEGEVARLKAELEHVMANCIPASALDEAREALEQVVDCLEKLPADGWSDGPHLLRVCRSALSRMKP